MTLDDFLRSIQSKEPPENLAGPLKALWWDQKGDWDHAHRIVQEIPTDEASWVHAYLHRKEGDLWNARYWYNRAGKQEPPTTLDAEWQEICSRLLTSEPL